MQVLAFVILIYSHRSWLVKHYILIWEYILLFQQNSPEYLFNAGIFSADPMGMMHNLAVLTE